MQIHNVSMLVVDVLTKCVIIKVCNCVRVVCLMLYVSMLCCMVMGGATLIAIDLHM